MSDTVPLITDSEGVRWARIPAKEFARLYPHHQTYALLADSLNFVHRREDAETLRDWLSNDDARLFLRGDEYHANDYYDITDLVRGALEGTDSDREDLMRRLNGRHVLRTLVERAKRPNWWTAELPSCLNTLVRAIDVDGVLLGDDWVPDFDPDYPVYPWVPHLKSRLEEQGVVEAWLFETGEPSVQARSRAREVLSAFAMENLASVAAATGRRLGVGFPLNRQRKWWVSPQMVAQRGFVPFLTTALPLTLDRLTGSEMMRVAEIAATSWLSVRSRFVGVVKSKGALGWVGGAGIALEANRSLSVGSEGSPRADVLLLAAHDDGWAHGWDETTSELWRIAHRLAEMLSARGIGYVVVADDHLDEMVRRMNPALMLVAPRRNLSGEALTTLTEWVNSGRYLGFLEPAPYLVEGKRSASLEGLLMRRRVRRLLRDDKALEAFLRRARVRPTLGVFDRATGEPLWPLYRHSLKREGEMTDTFLVADARRVLVELDGERSLTLRRDGVEIATTLWYTDRKTYLEVEAEPDVTYTLQSRLVSNDAD